jgi:hypothetical protein
MNRILKADLNELGSPLLPTLKEIVIAYRRVMGR